MKLKLKNTLTGNYFRVGENFTVSESQATVLSPEQAAWVRVQFDARFVVEEAQKEPAPAPAPRPWKSDTHPAPSIHLPEYRVLPEHDYAHAVKCVNLINELRAIVDEDKLQVPASPIYYDNREDAAWQSGFGTGVAFVLELLR